MHEKEWIYLSRQVKILTHFASLFTGYRVNALTSDKDFRSHRLYPPSLERARLRSFLDSCTFFQTTSAPSITSVPVTFFLALSLTPFAFNEVPLDLLAAAAAFERTISSLVFWRKMRWRTLKYEDVQYEMSQDLLKHGTRSWTGQNCVGCTRCCQVTFQYRGFWHSCLRAASTLLSTLGTFVASDTLALRSFEAIFSEYLIQNSLVKKPHFNSCRQFQLAAAAAALGT